MWILFFKLQRQTCAESSAILVLDHTAGELHNKVDACTYIYDYVNDNAFAKKNTFYNLVVIFTASHEQFSTLSQFRRCSTHVLNLTEKSSVWIGLVRQF